MSTMENNSEQSFATLSPDCVLDALDSIGLRGDGRLLALNSYENRLGGHNLLDLEGYRQKIFILFRHRSERIEKGPKGKQKK